MVRRSQEPVIPSDREIRRLKDDLRSARTTIVALMPESFQKAANGYYSCRTRTELFAWRRDLVDEAVALAKPDPAISHFSPRGYCPLCRRGTMGPYEDGFSLPEGLRRHLDGYGNVHRCEVLQAAFELAWDDLRDTLDEADRAERQIAQARRDSEVLYRIGPDELRLSDEFLFGEARGPEALVWAEERLASLGFNPSVDGRVRSYCMQDGDVSIYADPRPAGKIEFRVYRTAAGRKRRAPHYASFHILDGWKNDLMRKYRRGLDEAVARL